MLKEKSTQLMIRHQDIDKLEQYYFKFPFNQQTQFQLNKIIKIKYYTK